MKNTSQLPILYILIVSMTLCGCSSDGWVGVKGGDGDVPAVGGDHDPDPVDAEDEVEVATCDQINCGDHGECSVEFGVPACVCDTGYVGARCESCDEATGWHWNASGDACTKNPCDPDLCVVDNQRVCDAETGRCVCDAGFCDIDAACIADGTENPNHVCLICDSTTDKYGWAPRGTEYECRASAGECDVAEFCDGLNHDCPTDGFVTEGAVCEEDDNPCTDNICLGGVCSTIFDNANSCEDAVDCTVTECRNGACIVSGTHSGCYVNELCLEEGVIESATGDGSCRVCDSAMHWDSWTAMESDGCDDANVCTHTDTCGMDGVCAGTAYSCNDHGNCNDYDDICTCAMGYAGDYCDQCAEGYVGYPDCELFRTPGFVFISAGTFWMGSPDGNCPPDYPGDCSPEWGRREDETLHEVTLTIDFEMSQHEVTEAEFRDAMGYNPLDYFPWFYEYGHGETHPVRNVSWYDALAYANQISLNAGLTACYVLSDIFCTDARDPVSNYMECFYEVPAFGIESATVTLAEGATKPQDCEGYRLPTEAEWEYAARAGTTTAFYSGDIIYWNYRTDEGVNVIPEDPNLDRIAWFYFNSDNSAKPVGMKEPNAWGLYDMSGNIMEWVWDRYQAEYQNDSAIDPFGPSSGLDRVERGGVFSTYPQNCRSAIRFWNYPHVYPVFDGFRVVRSVF